MKTLLVFVMMLPVMVTAQQITFEEHTGHGITGIQGIMINADVNNDGIDDIFTSGFTHYLNGTYGGAILYLGNGNGGFAPASNQPVVGNQFVTNAKFVHYNSDSHIDLVTTYVDMDTNQVFISILLNDGTGNFTPTYTFEVDGVSQVGSLEIADLDNDGDMDIFVSLPVAPNFPESFIYRNDNNVFTKITPDIHGFSGGAVIFDYDKDGLQDILISGGYAQVNRITKLYRNLGNLNFQEVATPFTGLAYPSIAVGNIDNNAGGYESVILAGATASGDVLEVYLNDNGVFTLHQSLPGTQQGKVLLGDFDNDGHLDLFAVGGMVMTASARAYVNLGDGTFELRRTFQPGLAGAAAVLVDFNSDDKLDIIYSGLDTGINVDIRAFRNTTQTISIDDFNAESVVMYPNPTRGQLYIDLPNGLEITGIVVTDMLGRSVVVEPQYITALPQPQWHIDMSRFSSGVYLVTVQSDGAQVTKRVIKN